MVPASLSLVASISVSIVVGSRVSAGLSASLTSVSSVGEHSAVPTQILLWRVLWRARQSGTLPGGWQPNRAGIEAERQLEPVRGHQHLISEKFARRSVRDDHAVGEYDGARAQLQGVRQVMGHHQHLSLIHI